MVSSFSCEAIPVTHAQAPAAASARADDRRNPGTVRESALPRAGQKPPVEKRSANAVGTQSDSGFAYRKSVFCTCRV
jgi:hypothetical protein